MATLSLVMIVKDEETTLSTALKTSHLYADEIIIVDTGSTDNTKEIAKEYTKDIYDFTWVDDFSKARNFAISKATKDYSMWLDADDVVEEKEAKAIKKLMKSANKDIYMLPYNYMKSEYEEKGIWIRARIFKNRENIHFIYPIHETVDIKPSFQVGHAPIPIYHVKSREQIGKSQKRNQEIWKKLLKKQKSFDARMWWVYGTDGAPTSEKAIQAFQKAVSMQDGSIDDYQLAEIYYKIAQRYIFLKKYDDAKEYLQKSIDMHIPWREPFFLSGVMMLYLKQYPEAIHFFTECQKISIPVKGTTDPLIYLPSEIHWWIAVCYFRWKKFPQAFWYWLISRVQSRYE